MTNTIPPIPAWAQLARLRDAREQLPAEVQVPAFREVDGISLICENLQVTGSYKVRAVCHLLGRLREQLPPAGIGLASSGNFAVALAWAGRRYGVPVTAVMMRRSHPWKVARVRDYGGRVVFCADSTEDRTAALLRLQDEGVHVVDHLTDPEVLVGHSTLGVDISRIAPRRVLVPASTGGLLAATALALKQVDPSVRVIGVQPAGADAMVRSFRCGELTRLDTVVTECDALTANRPGDLPWDIARSWVDEMVAVSESAVHEAVCWAAEHAKLVVEPGGAAGLAAYRSGQIAEKDGTWVVLSGGNIAPARLAEWLART